jgi:Na+-driven multidrug efflux pump
MPGFGYSIAASAFVGQNLGAKHVRRANAGAWAATWQAVVIMTLMGFVFASFAEPFARFFIKHGESADAAQAAQVNETIRLTALYLKIALFSEPFLALGMVLTGALQGAGDTLSPTAITITTMVVLRLPLSYYCLTHFGVTGAWWAMTVSTIAQGILTVWLFKQGKWRKKKV